MPRQVIGSVMWDNGDRDTIYTKGGLLLVNTDTTCDFCGRKKNNCSPYKGSIACRECQDANEQEEKLYKAAKQALAKHVYRTVVNRMARRA
jgi:hypothetical protein